MKHSTCYLVTLWLPIYFDRSLITGFIKGKNTTLKRHKIYNKGPSLSLSVLRYVSKCPNTLYRYCLKAKNISLTLSELRLCLHCHFFRLLVWHFSGLIFFKFPIPFQLGLIQQTFLNSIPHVSVSLWRIKEEVLYGRDRSLQSGEVRGQQLSDLGS